MYLPFLNPHGPLANKNTQGVATPQSKLEDNIPPVVPFISVDSNKKSDYSNGKMSDHVVIEQSEEDDDYYEEEILSYTGLSTIWEGENESCSSRHSDSVPEKATINCAKRADSFSLTPTSVQAGTVDASSRPLSLISPLLFSPMAEARKLKLSSFKSPLIGSKAKFSPSPGRGSKTLTISNIPLVLTNLETGEEYFFEGDDDEYTFVSCSDTESNVGRSQSFMGDDSLILDEIADDAPNITEQVQETSNSSFSKGPLHHLHYHHHNNHRPPAEPAHVKMDFEETKKRLENALEQRMQTGKLPIERMDYMRRKLRYNMQRKMIEQRLNQCLIPPKT